MHFTIRRVTLIHMNKPLVNITTRQLAESIPVDPSTVRRWVEKGKLTPAVITPGGHYRFDAETVQKQLAAIRSESARSAA